MLDLLKIRIEQGPQYIPDDRKAELNPRFRGLPVLNSDLCGNCGDCLAVCPTGAIALDPLSIDMGKCVFCGNCSKACKANAITFSNFHKTSSTSRGFLKVKTGMTKEDYIKAAIETRKEIIKIFGHSLKLRNVSAGGCNGCELELNACSNVNFDMGRFGIDIVASPRHADGIIITGPVSENMAYALEGTFNAIPEPKIVIAVGACAISGGPFHSSSALNREFFERHKVDLYVPGCPAHPLTIINGLLAFLAHY
jgi:Ni,Fe-hydrogenase III small subunit/NAD-dependent dihydropyrimidine dehydrogenase PreA subunit